MLGRTVARNRMQSIPEFRGKHEIRGTRCFPGVPFPVVFYSEACSTYCRGRNYACTAETNIQPMRNFPWSSSSSLSSSERKDQRWERMFEITSRQTTSASLLDKTCMEYERIGLLTIVKSSVAKFPQNRLVSILITDFLPILIFP